MSATATRVRIVGAGFSGLTAAYFLVKRGFQVEIFEEQSRPGGLIGSHPTPHGLVETGANGILNSALLEDVARDVGIVFRPCRRTSRRRFVWREGKPRQWPLGLWETLKAAGRFFWAGWRFGTRAPRPQESVADWGHRIFGPDFTERLLAPALQGIYAGDHGRMSASLVFGRFFGRPRPRPPRPSVRGTVAPKDGMGAFLEALARWLESQGALLHRDRTVSATEVAAWAGKNLVLAVSARRAALLTREISRRLSVKLESIEMLPIASVTLFFSREAGHRPGFGCLFPRDTGFHALGVLFNTFIFEDRGTGHSETWIFRDSESPDVALLARIEEDRRRLYGVNDKPLHWKLTRWPWALPHYTLELERLLPEIRQEALVAGVRLAGNYLGTLGLSGLLERSRELAEEIASETTARAMA